MTTELTPEMLDRFEQTAKDGNSVTFAGEAPSLMALIAAARQGIVAREKVGGYTVEEAKQVMYGWSAPAPEAGEPPIEASERLADEEVRLHNLRHDEHWQKARAWIGDTQSGVLKWHDEMLFGPNDLADAIAELMRAAAHEETPPDPARTDAIHGGYWDGDKYIEASIPASSLQEYEAPDRSPQEAASLARAAETLARFYRPLDAAQVKSVSLATTEASDLSRMEGLNCEPSGAGENSRCNGLKPDTRGSSK